MLDSVCAPAQRCNAHNLAACVISQATTDRLQTYLGALLQLRNEDFEKVLLYLRQGACFQLHLGL